MEAYVYKHQEPNNGGIYSKILDELKAHASTREENVQFTAVQLRNKFKNLLQNAKRLP